MQLLIPYILQGASLGLAAASLPGPFQAFLFAQTLNFGWRRSIGLIAAPLISDGPIILAFVLLLAQVSDAFLGLIQTLGGLLLLYLAYESLASIRNPEGAFGPGQPAARLPLVKAVLINGTGPGPYLFWGLVGAPILIDSWHADPSLTTVFLIGFYLALLSGFALLVFLFSLGRRAGPRMRRMFIGLSAVILVIFGLQLILQGAADLGSFFRS